ncbi:hypothetical protein ES703_118512 [subsurface metagenome]
MVKMAKGPFMEYLRANAIQTTMNVYVETQIPTPTSKTENMAMLIHSIELHPSTPADAAPANGDTVSLQLSKTSKSAIMTLAVADIIAKYKVQTVTNATYLQLYEIGQQKQTFDPPILYPHANLYFATNTVGFAAVTSAYIRIGYTLEKVSREDFISALVE